MRKEIETATKLLIYGSLLAGASTFAFGSDERRKIENRDNSQCGLCNSKNIIVSHHIIPECLENGNDYTSLASDSYVRPIYEFYQKLLNSVPEQKRKSFRKSVKEKIHSAENGMALCKNCHQSLHKGLLVDDNLILDFAKRNGHLPKSLKTIDVCEFFTEKFIFPTFEELGIRVTPPEFEPEFSGQA